MVKLIGSFGRLEPNKVLVIGDFLLDTYTIGKARRISPEAPVAVVNVESEESKPGGAGNVVLNLVSLGAKVVAVGRIGKDNGGIKLRESLEEEGVDLSGLVEEPGYTTPVKNRVIADHQQIVRVDHEKVVPLPELIEEKVIDLLLPLIEEVKVIAISDYGKGFLTNTLLSSLIEIGKEKKIPIIADPKGIDFSRYAGVTIIKPNLMETYAAANLLPSSPLEQAAQVVMAKTQAEALMVTRSEEGISFFTSHGERKDFPVKVQEVNDVTGAGDTVLAMLAFSLASDLSIEEAIQLSNMAAGLAVERFGCARITLSDLAHRLLAQDTENKVFDEEHLFTLKEALRGKEYALLGLSTDEGITPEIFNLIKEVSEQKLLIYIRNDDPDPKFIQMLASFQHVDYIILKKGSLRNLYTLLKPSTIHLIEEGVLKKNVQTNTLLIN